MLAQINSIRGAIFVLALALLFSGCTPTGPRALLKGKKYLDRGDIADAVTQLKRATTLLSTNANAWNNYGVALQRDGQADEAAAAYQNALRLDHDLVEVHYNLGILSLEQNKPDVAKAELTTYTLRRPNDARGWLKLGFAQLQGGESLSAEGSFSAVHSLKTDDAEAFNGLGLARLQEGKLRDASGFFAAAVQSRADFAPALLNLATVNEQYLHDHRAALANYQAYLALNPRPANYNDVKAIIASLMQSDAAATIVAPAVIRTSAPPSETKPKITIVTAPHPAPPVHTETTDIYASHVPSRTNNESPSAPAPVVVTVPSQTVQVQPEQPIVASPKTNLPFRTTPVVAARTPATNRVTNAEPLEVPMPEEQPKTGFWHRMFGYQKPSTNTAKRYHDDAITPIPAPTDEVAGTKAEEKPPEPKPAPAPSLPRYNYTSPQKPAVGDRRTAEGTFTKARLAEQDENWIDAEQWYQISADTDPSWFEAQYNTGVIAHRLRNYSVALPRYELALAIQPESVDARYNFALALKASGYPLDAADELKKILAANPDEVRAHLALANLCAQSLHDVPGAREHYLKVLDLQPDNPQAADIRFWLSANAK
ncbi:MAG TPA: tetratricopeptide repeat protein [Verrucomicrobiae bacterium]|nr:tetratricopeptide repeat protein [Verrucomicrobiae bacterium]